MWLSVVCTLVDNDTGHHSGQNVVQQIELHHKARALLSNGNRTEWSPIQSVIIRVITKWDDRAAGVRFVYREYDYRLNWTTRSPIIN